MFNILQLLQRLLFIYQQEYYQALPLLKFAYSKRVLENPAKRQTLDWTPKAKLLYGMSLAFFVVLFISAVLQFWWFNGFVLFFLKTVAAYAILLCITPLLLITATVVLTPLDSFLKWKKIEAAKEALKKHKSHLKVIGITGSYGKTSVKELLQHVLSSKFSVIATEGNKNTPLGFVELVKEISISHQVLLVEMGAFYKGDIKEMCELSQPDYGVLTGINEQHYERFGSLETTIQTKNELSAYLPETATLWVNGEDERARTTAPKFAKCKVAEYNKNIVASSELSNDGKQKITLTTGESFQANIIADYFASFVSLALQVGEELGMKQEEIIKALETVQPAEHRLATKYYSETDVLIIDDSYNGNPDGALAACKTLGKFKGKNRIYLTPGLVELGEKSQEVHEKLGKNLAFNCDEVWLIQNSVTDYILSGLKKSQFDESKITVFPTSQEAHRACRDVVSGTVLLLQNDWTDNYS